MSLEQHIHEDGAVAVGTAQGFPWPYTTVGSWQAGEFWQVIGRNAYNVAIENGIKPDGESHFGENPTESVVNIFFKMPRQNDADKAAALFANPEMNFTPTAKLVRVFSCDMGDMLPPGQFNNTFTVTKAPFNGRGDWKPFAYITLPSIVYSYAKYHGWPVPELSFAEISDPKNMTIRADEVDKVWDKLLLQRVELWKALGEENYKLQLAKGAIDARTGQAAIGTTESDMLSKALHFAQARWENVYAAVGQVGYPGSKRRIPVINHVFDTAPKLNSS